MKHCLPKSTDGRNLIPASRNHVFAAQHRPQGINDDNYFKHGRLNSNDDIKQLILLRVTARAANMMKKEFDTLEAMQCQGTRSVISQV